MAISRSIYVPGGPKGGHMVTNEAGEKIQLSPSQPGYDLNKALPYLGEIASRSQSQELIDYLKNEGVYDQAMAGWGARYNDLVAEDLRNYAALAASRGISVPANMTEKNLQDYQNLLDQIEIEKQIADGRITEAPQPLPSGNFTDVGPSVGPPGYSGSFFNLDSKMQEEYAELQKKYNDLVKNQSNTVSGSASGSGSSGGTVGGGVVDDNSSFNPGQTGLNLGNTGKVYGPDGKEYSSAAAAIAAGVTNFTSSPPELGPGLIAGADTLNNQFLQPSANTGSTNPGAGISNQNQQLFNMGAPKIKLPGNIANPFSA